MSIKTTIARPYAKAAFAVAVKHETIANWSDLLQRAAAIVSDPSVLIFLQNPRVPHEDQLACVVNLCAPYIDGREREQNFFKLLSIKHRLDCLAEIAELFEFYRIEQEKAARVEVICAIPLSAVEQKDLIQALTVRLQRDVSLDCQVDSSLLGGLIIKTGDWV